VGAIVFSKVTKLFPQRNRANFVALQELDMTIGDREFYCLLGPSGCGKTTALSLLAGFELPSSGKIAHNGREITQPSSDRGVIFQSDDALYPWLTASENVAFGLKMSGVSKVEREAIGAEYLKLVGLSGQGHKYPRELSGGMKQRIQIARVLANRPQTLLMDEPFAALDAQTRKRMQDELVRIWQSDQKQVLFITHDIVEALVLADRIGVMRAGPASRLREEVAVDLPRPRDRTAPRMIELYRHINRLVEEEVEAARARTES
jgi:NitT/TauT family transport system ATP-binding protein